MPVYEDIRRVYSADGFTFYGIYIYIYMRARVHARVHARVRVRVYMYIDLIVRDVHR